MEVSSPEIRITRTRETGRVLIKVGEGNLQFRDCHSFPGSVGKNQPTMQETQETRARFLGWEAPLEEELVTHSSILA